MRSVFLSLLLAASACACSPHVVRHGDLQQGPLDDLVSEISALRELPPVRPVRFRLVGTKRLEADFARELGQDVATGELSRRQRVWATLGLVDWGLDLEAHYRELFRQLPAGYYEDEAQGVRVVFRNYLRSELTEVFDLLSWRDQTYGTTLAHETVHALQDQHFGLDAMLSGVGADGRLARRGLVEGDALLAAFRYDDPILFSDVRQFLRFIRRTVKATSSSGGELSWLEERTLFPYTAGTLFVAALYEHGGWAAVNAAYADPPTTTAELLHPERYLAREPRPAAHDLSAVRDALGDDWIALLEEPVGEYAIRHLLSGPMGRGAAGRLAAAWQGDRALVVQRRGGGRTALIWTSRWDNPEHAKTFAEAYRGRLAHLGRRDASVVAHGSVALALVGFGEETRARLEQPALAGAGSPGTTPAPRPPFVPAPVSTEAAAQHVELLAAQDVAGWSDGPLLTHRSGDATLAAEGIVQLRIDSNDLGETQTLFPRAGIRLSGVIEPLLELGYVLGVELSPEPDEPTEEASGLGRLGGGVLQDAAIRMRLTSVNLPDLGAFTLGRAQLPLLVESGTEARDLPLSRRSLLFDHLLPVRTTGISYAVSYAQHGVPLGFAVAGGRGIGGARAALVLADSPAPRPRFELGVVYIGRTPVDPGDPESLTLLGADLAARWRGFRVDGAVLAVDVFDDGLEQLSWSLLLGYHLIPDFMELLARYDRVELDPSLRAFTDLSRLTWGVALHYLPSRFRIAFEQDRDAEGADPLVGDALRTTRFLVSLAF